MYFANWKKVICEFPKKKKKIGHNFYNETGLFRNRFFASVFIIRIMFSSSKKRQHANFSKKLTKYLQWKRFISKLIPCVNFHNQICTQHLEKRLKNFQKMKKISSMRLLDFGTGLSALVIIIRLMSSTSKKANMQIFQKSWQKFCYEIIFLEPVHLRNFL